MKTRSGLETEKFDDELNGLLDSLGRRTGAVELAFLRKAAAEAIKAERAARGELPQ